MNIRRASLQDVPAAAALAGLLWPAHTREELEEELRGAMDSGAVFLALEGEEPAGFAECQIRHDYVEGTSGPPVGYLEGIFVAEPFRGQGVARSLLRACEGWAAEQGCREFASDCELTNTASLRFHLGCGFEEANRIICFTKRL